MDSVSPPNVPDDPVPDRSPVPPPTAQDAHAIPGPEALSGYSGYHAVSFLTGSQSNDTDSLHTASQSVVARDCDSMRTGNAASFDTDSTQTGHLGYDTDSNRTLNPAFDSDSTRTLHHSYPTCRAERMGVGMERAPTQAGIDDGPTTSCGLGVPPTTATDEPPPYSPPDPKLAYLMYPPPLPHYTGQPVLTCQPGPNPPAFYQPQFMPSTSYPSYAIYMNSPPMGEEQPSLPKDYLVESLLVTIFCCLMSGLIAVMYSYETRAALARGDVREGERASQKARFLVMFSLMFGVFVVVGWVIYVVVVLCA